MTIAGTPQAQFRLHGFYNTDFKVYSYRPQNVGRSDPQYIESVADRDFPSLHKTNFHIRINKSDDFLPFR